MNILVCDDDKEIVEAISIYLEQEGYTVCKAYDGLDALEIVNSQNMQLLIIDVMMPNLDGIHAVLELRKKSNIPVIMYAVTLGSFNFLVTLVIKNPPNSISAIDIIVRATGDKLCCNFSIVSNIRLHLL